MSKVNFLSIIALKRLVVPTRFNKNRGRSIFPDNSESCKTKTKARTPNNPLARKLVWRADLSQGGRPQGGTTNMDQL